MRIAHVPALMIAALLSAAGAATVTTERSFSDLRAADIGVTFHDVQIQVGQASTFRLSVTTQAEGPGAAEAVRRAQPTITYQAGKLTLRPAGGSGPGSLRGLRGRVVLTLPPGAALMVQTASGDVALSGAARQVPTRLASASGNLSVASGTTVLNLASASGNLSVTGPARRLNLTSLSGNVTVQAPVADARLSSASGDLRLAGLTGALEARTDSGKIWADWAAAPRGPLRVESLSGDITLSLPTSAPGGRLATLSGDLRSDFPGASGDDLAGASLRMTGTAVQLDVRSLSGNIELRRR